MAENEAIRRLQASIDMLKERMRIDSNDLEIGRASCRERV